jgi:dihydrofolate reductase
MRRLRYSVAVSLDGFIARPDGAYDWIIMDPAIDFAALFDEFDTLVMGRRTFEVTRAQQADGPASNMRVIVCSRTLRPSDYPDVTIIGDDVPAAILALKKQPGKDVWLFGGGELCRSLLDAGLVDTIELAVMPVLLSEGIPVLPPGQSLTLRLTASRTLPSGILMLSYAVPNPAAEGDSRS